MGQITRALDLRWTLLLASAAVVATALFLQGASIASYLLAQREAVLGGELWRLLTGPLVHATWGHLVRDLALLVAVGFLFERELGWRWPTACVAGMVGPTLACFAYDPALAGVLGTSGLTHTLLALALGHVLLREPDAPPWMRYAAFVGALLLAGKVGYEVLAAAPLFAMDLGPNVRQLPMAHFSGALLGAAIALVPARVNVAAATARTATGAGPAPDAR